MSTTMTEKMGVSQEWADGRRKAFLLSECQDIADKRSCIQKALPSQLSIEQRAMFLAELDDLHNDYRKAQRKIHALDFPNRSQISDDDIETARQADVRQFLPEPVKRNKIKCFNHDDKSPSMQVNDTWVYCHSCCRRWDSIDVVRQLQRLDFVRAVKFINS